MSTHNKTFQKVTKVGGYDKMPTAWIPGKKPSDILTWGKHLLFVFSNDTLRVHLGLFEGIIINERKKVNRTLFLEFNKGEISGYDVRAQKLDKDPKELYDWRMDILSDHFDPSFVQSLLKTMPGKTIDDVLMDLFLNELEAKIINKTFSVYQQEFSADGSEVAMKILPRSKRKIFFSEHSQKLYT